jgi:lipoprotein-releasing system permease protein
MPFEWLLALRFLREGRMQSFLILAGVTGGVAVIIFLTQLINQLQSTIIDRVLGSQAHIVIRPTEDLTRPVLDAGQTSAQVQPRAQRLRSVDQWENMARLASQTAGVLAVSPVVSGAGFALRGGASKSVAIMGVQPEDYQRVVNMPSYMVQGRFEVSGTNTLIGIELAKDLGVSVGDKLRLITARRNTDHYRLVRHGQ